MANVTDSEVKEIINVSDTTTLKSFIDTAHLIVSEQLSNKGLSEGRKKKIELYLSAHLASAKEKQLKSQKFGDASESYQGSTGMNLAASMYGQTAMMLDTSGTLKSTSEEKSFIGSFEVL